MVPSLVSRLFCLVLVAALAGACGEGVTLGEPAGPENVVAVGLPKGAVAQRVASGLTNPSGIDFSPEGMLTICDSGKGRIVEVDLEGGELTTRVEGFATQYWKLDPDRYKLGPLDVLWLDDGTLVVSDGGHPDGEDRLVYLPAGADTVDEGRATNGIPPTSDAEIDKGEGNFIGLSLDPDGKTIWVAGQGADAKSWVMKSQVATASLETAFSSDENGIETNSPMDTASDGRGGLYVLYSGTGGEEDGLIVLWDKKSGKPSAQWKLPGLVDPMGMAWHQETKTFFVVDNNWALTHVNPGKLAQVRLPKGGGEAKVTVLANQLDGPVTCRFGPDGRLYVACLGEEFDANAGEVLAISGLFD